MGRFSALIEELGLAKSIADGDGDTSRDTSAVEDGDLDEDDDRDLVAVLGILKKMYGVMVAQGGAIDAMRVELDSLKGAGAQPMTKGQAPDGLTSEAFMAKALSAQAAGRINGTKVAIAESYINAGKQPPADIVAAVLREPA